MAGTVAGIARLMDGLYDPAWAEPDDAVGLVCGEPDAPVDLVAFAVDPVPVVVEEALAHGAQLLVTHHPLFHAPVHGVPATSTPGRIVHRLIGSGTALFVAHTNADVASPGVSDALGAAVGLQDMQPLQPAGADPTDKLVTFVPPEHVPRLLDALAAAGAGTIGEYTRCAYLGSGEGTFLPGAAANPVMGDRGQVEVVTETRVEMVLPRGRRAEVVAALRATHPYEEPAFDLYELAGPAGRRGLGRAGELPVAVRLSEFVAQVGRALPPTTWGVRAAGDPDTPVQRVAVCGGAGGSLIGPARAAGADVLLTADLRHHPASDAWLQHGLAVVDVAHWATEWPWLPAAADRLRRAAAEAGTTVSTVVSKTLTDPWTLHESGPRS